MAVSESNARIAVKIPKQLKEIMDLHSEITGMSLSKLGEQVVIRYYKDIGIDGNNTSLSDARKILLELRRKEIEEALTDLKLAET